MLQSYRSSSIVQFKCLLVGWGWIRVFPDGQDGPCMGGAWVHGGSDVVGGGG